MTLPYPVSISERSGLFDVSIPRDWRDSLRSTVETRDALALYGAEGD